ncbi:hypothetical protein SynPROS91_01240 [Synechococcus sp. PROS-9-1]|nr:hypothetical protein SynPROS91_01240 [Synechococcus sp. PROS-9-1]
MPQGVYPPYLGLDVELSIATAKIHFQRMLHTTSICSGGDACTSQAIN